MMKNASWKVRYFFYSNNNVVLQLLDSYGVTLNNLHSSHQKITIKKNIVDMAKDWPMYFARIFPVSVS
jgi:myosin-15